MKKLTALFLTLLLLTACTGLAEAPELEALIYEVTYEAETVQLPDSDFVFEKPVEWPVCSEEWDPNLRVGNDFSINISISLQYATLEEIRESLTRSGNPNVTVEMVKTINGYPCLTYQGFGQTCEYLDLGDGAIVCFEVNLVKMFLENYDEVLEMVYQMIGSVHLPE